ncbi:MAG: hypothetical protein ACK4NU_00790 [Brevundimonas sp.]
MSSKIPLADTTIQGPKPAPTARTTRIAAKLKPMPLRRQVAGVQAEIQHGGTQARLLARALKLPLTEHPALVLGLATTYITENKRKAAVRLLAVAVKRHEKNIAFLIDAIELLFTIRQYAAVHDITLSLSPRDLSQIGSDTMIAMVACAIQIGDLPRASHLGSLVDQRADRPQRIKLFGKLRGRLERQAVPGDVAQISSALKANDKLAALKAGTLIRRLVMDSFAPSPDPSKASETFNQKLFSIAQPQPRKRSCFFLCDDQALDHTLSHIGVADTFVGSYVSRKNLNKNRPHGAMVEVVPGGRFSDLLRKAELASSGYDSIVVVSGLWDAYPGAIHQQDFNGLEKAYGYWGRKAIERICSDYFDQLDIGSGNSSTDPGVLENLLKEAGNKARKVALVLTPSPSITGGLGDRWRNNLATLNAQARSIAESKGVTVIETGMTGAMAWNVNELSRARLSAVQHERIADALLKSGF